WFRSLFQNLKETVVPPKLPPLMLTSQPVAVKDIWGLYGHKKESGLMSLLVHGVVVLLLFTVLSNPSVQVRMKKAAHLIAPGLSPYLPHPAAKPMNGGGGGEGSPMP